MSGTRLTITLDLRTEPSVETAMTLVHRWLADELSVDGGVMRPLKVAAARIEGQGLPIPDSALGLARRRKDLHLTQKDVADRAGLDREQVSQVEHGHVSLNSGSAVAVCRVLADAEARR